MHSVIPHKHANELGDYSQSEAFTEADGWMDYIELLFLIDLGECHMENFNQGKEFDLDVEFQIESSPEIYIVPISAPSLTFRDTRQNYYKPNCIDDAFIIRQYFLSHIDFRGPPTIA